MRTRFLWMKFCAAFNALWKLIESLQDPSLCTALRILTIRAKSYKSSGAEDGNRTRTVVTYRRILSPVRLPVPPPRHARKL